jgi:hypothetical protein
VPFTRRRSGEADIAVGAEREPRDATTDQPVITARAL